MVGRFQKDEIERMWRKIVIECFRLKRLPGRTEENHEIHNSRQSASETKFKPGN
jgi:hypothetical protein